MSSVFDLLSALSFGQIAIDSLATLNRMLGTGSLARQNEVDEGVVGNCVGDVFDHAAHDEDCVDADHELLVFAKLFHLLSNDTLQPVFVVGPLAQLDEGRTSCFSDREDGVCELVNKRLLDLLCERFFVDVLGQLGQKFDHGVSDAPGLVVGKRNDRWDDFVLDSCLIKNTY